MKSVVSQRIRSARKMAGLSLRELSVVMEKSVSYNAIAKYEKGEAMPNSRVLISLSQALKVKPDYFFRPYSVDIQNIAFRKKRGLGVKTMDSLKETISESIARYLEIERLLEMEPGFENPVNGKIIRMGGDIEDAADQLITRWKCGINAIPNVIDFLEDHNIKVIETKTSAAFDGLSGWADENIPVIVLNMDYSIERKRFTALHELGHLILEFDPKMNDLQKERLCHRFAGALLLPKETLFMLLGKKRTYISIPELIQIKEAYGISIQAIMARARDLQVIGESGFVRFCKWISKNREERDLGQYKGIEQSGRFKSLVYRAASEELISMSKAANLCNQKLAAFRDEFEVV